MIHEMSDKIIQWFLLVLCCDYYLHNLHPPHWSLLTRDVNSCHCLARVKKKELKKLKTSLLFVLFLFAHGKRQKMLWVLERLERVRSLAGFQRKIGSLHSFVYEDRSWGREEISEGKRWQMGCGWEAAIPTWKDLWSLH